jgi:hypothetical protein
MTIADMPHEQKNNNSNNRVNIKPLEKHKKIQQKSIIILESRYKIAETRKYFTARTIGIKRFHKP